MTHYAIITKDKPDTHATRMEHLQAHMAHIERVMDQIAIAGPLRDDGGAIIGSLLVVLADSEADAREFLSRDPYFKADIWESIDVIAFGAVAGGWVGGKTW